LGNSIISVFAWKIVHMLNTLGIKELYKLFIMMDSWLVYYMYMVNQRYDFNARRRWVTKKDLHEDGHTFLFLSHDMIFVPVNMDNVHWVLFSIWLAYKEILIFDSFFDPTSPH
jgi:Ulp1 family protease